jgi:peptidoglycan/xylan/chitin deacetylase (PgdA/CDA1 family)
MKSLIFMALASVQLFAISQTEYANLYADKLINDFDAKLDLQYITQKKTNILDSDIYYELLAARDFIEHNIENHELISFNQKDYKSVISKIKFKAREIKRNIQHYKNNNSVIFPSVTGAGNLTGNTYPQNVWSITFDDGPHPSRTQQTIDNFYTQGVKATYFVLTEKALRTTHIIDSTLDANMELALHSYTHKNLSSSQRTDEELEYEINKAKIDLENLSSTKIKLFRLPYGAGMRKASLRKRIADNNLIHVFWNVDTLDWKDKDPQSILARSLKQMILTPRKSGIILFHDIHNQSVIASKLLLDNMLNNNLTLCTVGEMVSYFNNQDQDCL